MNDVLLIAARDFLKAFEAVFGTDWPYARAMLGIHDETPEQVAAAIAFGLESIHAIAKESTFIQPNVDDEVENWGNRSWLLQQYRHLKAVLGE